VKNIEMLRGLGVVGIMAGMAACQGLDEESQGDGSADPDAALGVATIIDLQMVDTGVCCIRG
jgi:hypothetical protein